MITAPQAVFCLGYGAFCLICGCAIGLFSGFLIGHRAGKVDEREWWLEEEVRQGEYK